MNTTVEKHGATINITINIDDLADIRDVKIDLNLPKEEKLESYLRQIRNHNLHRYGDMIVRVSSADTNISLADRLKQYLLSGQGLTLS